MIQILLLIFKIIGWIILGILGILILLTSIFLIVPVRYQGTLLGEGELEKLSASLRFSWLCSLIKGEVCYRNGDFQWKMRLAWKQLSSEQLEKGSSPESQPTEEPVCQSKKTSEADSFYKTVQKKKQKNRKQYRKRVPMHTRRKIEKKIQRQSKNRETGSRKKYSRSSVLFIKFVICSNHWQRKKMWR